MIYEAIYAVDLLLDDVFWWVLGYICSFEGFLSLFLVLETFVYIHWQPIMSLRKLAVGFSLVCVCIAVVGGLVPLRLLLSIWFI